MSDPTPVRIRGLYERAEDNDFEGMTPAERVGMMWQLALDAWAFQGSGDAESRLLRHIVRVQRGKCASGDSRSSLNKPQKDKSE